MSRICLCPICNDTIENFRGSRYTCAKGHFVAAGRERTISSEELVMQKERAECVWSYTRKLHQDIMFHCVGSLTFDMAEFKSRWKEETYLDFDVDCANHFTAYMLLAGYLVAVGENAIVISVDSNFNPVTPFYSAAD